jgi:hypothetical protein
MQILSGSGVRIERHGLSACKDKKKTEHIQNSPACCTIQTMGWISKNSMRKSWKGKQSLSVTDSAEGDHLNDEGKMKISLNVKDTMPHDLLNRD